MMELDFDDSVVRGLHRYVRLVSRALGLRGPSSYIQSADPLSAYVAVDERFTRFPDRDVALLWDENAGWSAAIETHSGEDLRVVAYLGDDMLPPPEAVADWVRGLFQRDLVTLRHPDKRPANGDAMRRRLATYLDRDAEDRAPLRGGGGVPVGSAW